MVKVKKYEGTRLYGCPDCGWIGRRPVSPMVLCAECGARCRRTTLSGKLRPPRSNNNRAVKLGKRLTTSAINS